MRGVLALQANPSLGPDPIPLRERANSFSESLLGLALIEFYQCPFLNINIAMQGLEHAHTATRGVSLPEDVVRWEAHHVCSERL
jgi:hypothetical protein